MDSKPESGSQRLILFSGPPGVGKSSLSYRLAQHTGWAIVAKDQLNRTLETLNIPSLPPLTSYELIFGLAELNLANNVSLILDAVFPKAGFRQRALDLAAYYGASFYAIVCHCSDKALWQQRVEVRPEMVRGWTPANWTEVLRVESYYEAWNSPHLALDAVQPLDHNFQTLLQYISSPYADS